MRSFCTTLYKTVLYQIMFVSGFLPVSVPVPVVMCDLCST